MSKHVERREPAVAGSFYPADPAELHAVVEDCLTDAGKRSAPDAAAPKALIAPHAGYIYSGPIAASAYALLAPARGRIERVVLLGPAHRVAVRGIAASSAQAFATPLGDVPVDRVAVERALALPWVKVSDAAHAQEHSLEVHLPFLQVVLGDFRLAPFVVGEVGAEEVAELIEELWGGPETLILVSSDLSHYHDYELAQQLDRATSKAIEALRPDAISGDDACGFHPVRGLLLAARRFGLHPRLIDLRNSGDTAGSRDSVVGYGAYAFR